MEHCDLQQESEFEYPSLYSHETVDEGWWRLKSFACSLYASHYEDGREERWEDHGIKWTKSVRENTRSGGGGTETWTLKWTSIPPPSGLSVVGTLTARSLD